MFYFENDVMFLVNGNFRIFLSFEKGHDIAYYKDDCTLIANDRLMNGTENIARLHIECVGAVTDGFDIANTMDSEATEYVNHLSASVLEIVSNSSTYYPGELQQIDYFVTDRLGNVAGSDLAGNTTIYLVGDSFLSSLYIDENGICDSCGGIWISDVSIANSVGRNYTLQIYADSNQLVLMDNELIYEVRGCPIGYGADSMNVSCAVCGTTTFNMDHNFVGQCKECNHEENPSLVCLPTT